MNKPISFPLAKLVKEKGFDIPCTEGWINYLTSFTGETGMPDDESNLVLDRLGNPHLIERPTIADVVMWLYEKHEYWCYTYTNGKIWHPCIQHKFGDMAVLSGKIGEFNSPTEAYEKGIEYILNNMI